MVNGAAKCRQSSKFRIDVPFLITPPTGYQVSQLRELLGRQESVRTVPKSDRLPRRLDTY